MARATFSEKAREATRLGMKQVFNTGDPKQVEQVIYETESLMRLMATKGMLYPTVIDTFEKKAEAIIPIFQQRLEGKNPPSPNPWPLPDSVLQIINP